MFFRKNTPVVLAFVIPLHEYAMFVKETKLNNTGTTHINLLFLW